MAELRHLGIIPDGTRRWARRERMPLKDAYLKALASLCDYACDAYGLGTSSVSLYLLSKPNLVRGPADMDPYVEAGRVLLTEMLPALCQKAGAIPLLAGESDLLPAGLQRPMEDLLSRGGEGERRLYLCAPYDPEAELRLAARQWCENDCSGSPRDFMWVPEALDLVIRTGGAVTLSDFLPLQAGYAQILFLPQLFNDLTPAVFRQCLDEHLAKGIKRGA